MNIDLKPLLLYVALPILLLLAALIYGKWQHSVGYASGKATAEAAITKITTEEQSRQREANREATSDAVTVTLPRMLETQFDLQQTLKENDTAPLADPSGTCGGLGADSVRGLNRIRRPEAKP